MISRPWFLWYAGLAIVSLAIYIMAPNDPGFSLFVFGFGLILTALLMIVGLGDVQK